MKKKLLGVILAVGMLAALTACGQKGAAKATPDANGNYLVNGSFEEADFTGWTVTNIDDVTEEVNIYDRETDCFEGVQSLHFYSGSTNVNFTAEQTVSGLEDGSYKLTAHVQGEAAGDENASVVFYAIVDGNEIKVDGELNGYVNWYTAELSGLTPTNGEITVGVRVTTAPGGWGTIDDITLVKE
ncbi:MAG: lipoprotein [Lachnospiraceae bacterium]|nr:lipoprotein [Lachnospiraceae bacterium]MBD5481320.1 lipoprotein [Lachnospiraceae bacterium]